jgi:hypothetical protein
MLIITGTLLAGVYMGYIVVKTLLSEGLLSTGTKMELIYDCLHKVNAFDIELETEKARKKKQS